MGLLYLERNGEVSKMTDSQCCFNLIIPYWVVTFHCLGICECEFRLS